MPGFKRDIYRARHFGLALLLTLLALLPLEQGFHHEIAVGDGLEDSEPPKLWKATATKSTD